MTDGNGTGNRTKRTLVEEETSFKGTMTSKCPVVVMGDLDGEIDAPSMHISATGSVAGTVKVRQLSSEGTLAGTVEADSVLLSGSVKDNTVIRANTLEVKLKRTDGKMEVVFSECELEIGDEPNKEAAVEAALNPESGADVSDGAPVEAADNTDTGPTTDGDDAAKAKRRRRPSQQPPPG